MSFENYKQLHLCEKDKDILLRPGKSFSLDFNLDSASNADRVYMTGETAIYYNWKTEGDYEYLYRRLDDSLTSAESNKARFALDMSADNYDFPKIAYHKIVWWPNFYGGGVFWRTGVSVKAENLKINQGGYLRFLVEIRYSKGIDKRISYTEPDLVETIDIPEGTYEWRDFESIFNKATSPIANVCFYVEGIHYSGKVLFEKPYFCSENNENILPDFTTYTHEKPLFNWIGVNLSKIEWPSFIVKLNGTVIHDGEIFERCHRYSEWEFTIPEGIAKNGKNTLEIINTSDFRDAAPYNLHEIGIVSTKNDTIISCPDVIQVDVPFTVLVKTKRDNVEYSIKNAPEYLTPAKPLICKDKGLNVLTFVCKKAVNNIDFLLVSNGIESKCNISRCVLRDEDNVITGTGDSVYINQNDTDFENFIAWYFSNNIGNFITFRPTYRWSGSRTANSSLWKKTAKLLDYMGVKYVLMRDGRELPGCNANPTVEELCSKNFLGRQNHELDGSYVYWLVNDPSTNVNQQMYYDLFIRFALKDHERMDVRFSPNTYTSRQGKLDLYRDHTVGRDMEAIALSLVDGLKASRDGSERHTGPATLYKYFYQAGYSWTGAELMDSSTEITNSTLRGAAKVYGGSKGGHLAMQWSTSPHDTTEHAKRYRLALYTSYMQDIDDINTEEGLWRMEEYFSHHNRHSEACISHLRQKQDFYKYLSTHTRSGKFYTPVAFLNGRYDGWNAFSVFETVFYAFGRMDCPYIDAEFGWNMLDIFYPLSRPGAIFRHPCPNDKPIGYFSGTPNGSLDIIPIEAKDYNEYPLICAIGYNKALNEDMEKLSNYIHNGGNLFIGTAQLSTTTDRTDIENYSLTYIDHPFAKQISTLSDFVDDKYLGKEIRVCSTIPQNATVIQNSDNDRALIYSVELGKGKVYVLNTLEYAGNPGIYELVKKTISELSNHAFMKENAWAQGSDVVQFSAYKQENGDMHFYYLSTDWYNSDNPTHTAKLRIGEDTYDVNISFGTMIKAVVSNNIGAWFDCEDCDILEITHDTIKVQGIGTGTLNIAYRGNVTTKTIDFSNDSVKTIKVQ